MEKSNDELLEYIQSLPISQEQKTTLLGYWAGSKKELLRMDFQLKRTIKDKSIIINLLNRSIEELKQQQVELETANAELLSQKQLVEAQSNKLSEQLQMLEKSYAELEQFSYIASHDLKSPLRTIASYAGLLRRRHSDQLSPEAIDFIDYIVKGASHMNEIIRDLLEYAGIRKEHSIDTVDTNEVMNLVVQNLCMEISESKAEISFSNLPVLHAHETGLSQLFQNLIANAIKFRGDEPPAIHIQALERHRFWQFTVSDNGLGLDENFHEKAFMPFQRVNHLDRPGTGMGLAICKKIVKLHGGDIWFRSVLGQGTNFYFTIAKQDEEPEE
jgi:light-regulated signal transduction histidine kinase (bacteriophytochrome)